MEKRYIVYQGRSDSGFYTSRYSDTELEGKTVVDLFSTVIGIFKNYETVKSLVENDRNLYYQEINWEV